MSKSNFQFPNPFVQLYCHGIQMRCEDLNELLKTGNIDIKRQMQNEYFDFYEMKNANQTIASHFNHYHILLFKHSPSEEALKSFAARLTQASTVHEVLIRLSDYLTEHENSVQLRMDHKGENTEISLNIDIEQAEIDAKAMQFLSVLRLFKFIRIISHLAESDIPVYAIKIAGEFSELTTPYIKLHQPEFIYHRQKRNAFVIPTKCLSVRCKSSQTGFADFLRQHADVLLTWPTGTYSNARVATQPYPGQTQRQHPAQQNNLTLWESEKNDINKNSVDIIINSSIPASEVGRRLGIADSRVFSRTFKEMNKVKPGVFHNGRIIRLN